MFLLLLSLHLGLGWGSDPQGAPTAEEISFEEMAKTGGTWKPQEGKNSWGCLMTPQFLLKPSSCL